MTSRQTRERDEETFDHRIKRLTGSLGEAGRVVTEMEREILSRQQLVERLREEQKLLELSREEVDAVAQTLRGELQREGRKGFWLNAAQGFFFFALGVVATLVLG